MPSDARKMLDTRLAEIQQILVAHTITAGPGRGRKYGVSALNKGGLVLLCAHLEGFLEDLYSEAVTAITNARLSVSSVPDSLKVAGARQIANDIRSAGSRRERDRLTLRFLRKAARFGHPRALFSKGDAGTEAVLGTFRNPQPEEIDSLFRNLGIDGVLRRASWRGKSAATVRRELGALVDARNKVAHGQLTDVYKYQIRNHLNLVRRVASCVDSIVGVHVQASTSAAPW